MNDFFIFSFEWKSRSKTYSLIFCPREKIRVESLRSEIRLFYEDHAFTDELIILGGEYLKDELVRHFFDMRHQTFEYAPTHLRENLDSAISIFVFGEKGNLQRIKGKNYKHEELEEFINIGLVRIFEKRSGMIESPEAYHFVFPSGKHCDRFLRPGNVLLHSSEIYFIAAQLLKFYDEQNTETIFCDTSSINTLAFALVELKRRFVGELQFPSIESFSSYEGFRNEKLRFNRNSLILISASTSGNIIKRILESLNSITIKQIVVVYFVSEKKVYNIYREQVICNLTQYENSEFKGVELYDTFQDGKCDLCNSGSLPVRVTGDVFLPDRPKISTITLVKGDAPRFLSTFVEQFISEGVDQLNVVKCHFKENSNPDDNYEIFFDLSVVWRELMSENAGRFERFSEKFQFLISTYIPANVKYIIHLPDSSSKLLGELLVKKIKEMLAGVPPPSLISQDQIDEIPKDARGGAIIVSSCVVKGRNLLFISRALRKYPHLSRMYFIGLARPDDAEYFSYLKKNLGHGEIMGANTYPIVVVEEIQCSNRFRNTSWAKEYIFLQKLSQYCEELGKPGADCLSFVDRRIELLEENTNQGLANNIFFSDVIGGKVLNLRKGFAFLDFSAWIDHISQADTYFVISTILNHLRSAKRKGKSLFPQSHYVRTLLDPENFMRFNDGVLQASFLRAALPAEMQYRIDDALSFKMRSMIENIVKNHNNEHGEALLEFVFAIKSGSMTLTKEDTDAIFDQVKGINNPILNCFIDFV